MRVLQWAPSTHRQRTQVDTQRGWHTCTCTPFFTWIQSLTGNALNGGHPGAFPDTLEELPTKDELWFSSSSKILQSGASTFCIKAEQACDISIYKNCKVMWATFNHGYVLMDCHYLVKLWIHTCTCTSSLQYKILWKSYQFNNEPGKWNACYM